MEDCPEVQSERVKKTRTKRERQHDREKEIVTGKIVTGTLDL